MSRPRALILAFVSGYIALSYEILWYRAYSFAMAGRAQAFGLLLGAYLLGVAAGAFSSRIICRTSADSDHTARSLLWIITVASLAAFLFVPIFGWLMTVPTGWITGTMLVAWAAAGLGAVFPLVAQLSVPANHLVGSRVSHLYLANILGSSIGTILTGFVLLDRFSLGAISAFLAILGLGSAVALVPARRLVRSQAIALVLSALAILWLEPRLFDRIYDRLLFKMEYRVNPRLAHVVENRSGVIAVTADGFVYGSGTLDGAFNTDLREASLNLIQRPYLIGAFHPSPSDVLLVGFSSGSWAAIMANHPLVGSLTVVEINPGYLQLLPHYPVVSNIPRDPKIHIEIDDGRRWLARHPDARFDLIVSNATYDWRANATSLLSAEFLELVRRHLKPGGVYYFNSTGSARVQKTGASVFPYAWQYLNMLAVSDEPIRPDLMQLRSQLAGYRLYGQPVFDMARVPDRDLCESIVQELEHDLESRERILARTAGLTLVTDDNMGTEWQLGNLLIGK